MAFTIDPASDVPPFEQLRVQVARAAAAGDLTAGSSLPTVRALAAELGLAVNTVAKAYRALEHDGIIETRGRAGSRITAPHVSDPDAQEAAAAYVRTARRLAMSRAEAVLLIETRWEPGAR